MFVGWGLHGVLVASMLLYQAFGLRCAGWAQFFIPSELSRRGRDAAFLGFRVQGLRLRVEMF